MNIVFLVIGLIIGFLASWFIAKNLFSSGSQVLTEKLNGYQLTIDELKKQLTEKETQIITISKQLSYKEADLKNLTERLNEQKTELNNLQDKFRIEFKNLANEILEEKTNKFTEQNKTNLDIILKPLNDKIKEFEKKVEETYDKEAQQRFSLKEEVKRLAELNQQISKEANSLTRALKGESKTQGNWGEMILENILEKSGLVKDREFFVQSSFKSEDGNRLQPDVVIAYPGDRSIVVDSKVSLVAYERYYSSETEEDKETAKREHLISIKSHINGLSSKNYTQIYNLKTLDFVILFMPIETAYLLAMQTDNNLWNYAYEKKILLISPTNLVAALKMIHSMWQQEYQNRNAQEIAKKSGDLYDKFVDFVDDLINIGKQMDQTKKSYEGAMNKLSTGKGNLVKRSQDILELGIKNKKSLPPSLIDRSERNND